MPGRTRVSKTSALSGGVQNELVSLGRELHESWSLLAVCPAEWCL